MGGPARPPPPAFKTLDEFKTSIGGKYKNFEEFQGAAQKNKQGRLVYQSDRLFSDEAINGLIAQSEERNALLRANPGNRGAPLTYGTSASDPNQFSDVEQFRQYAASLMNEKSVSEGEARLNFAKLEEQRISEETRLGAERAKANADRDAQRRLQRRGSASAIAGSGGGLPARTLLTSTSDGLGNAQRRTILGG